MVRKALTEDFEFIMSLYFHPNINPYLLYEMAELSQFPTIFDDLLSKNLLYIFEIENKQAGMFKLVPLTYRNSHIVYLGGVALHPSFSGRGLGQQMMQEIIAFCQNQGILRIELSTATINERAIHLYEKVGFQKEGILRRYTYMKSENRFLDEVMMAYLLEKEV